ncbi:RNA polymerase sigma factor [bacterium]|nr:MAG: RNA polymerase sigma factor [bacterium]
MSASEEPGGGGEEAGLASVYMACRGALARAVGRIVKRHDIEDILQDAFVRSFEAEGRYRIRNARAFLLRTATNLALNHASRAGYRTTGDLEDLATSVVYATATESVEAEVDAGDRFQEFCRVVGGLPEQCRRAFILKKVYGLSQKEIALELGITESTVEKHIARGLVLCRDGLEAARRAGTPVARPRRKSA